MWTGRTQLPGQLVEFVLLTTMISEVLLEEGSFGIPSLPKSIRDTR